MKKRILISTLSAIGLLSLSACSEDYQAYNDPTSNYVAPEISNSVDQIIHEEARQAVASQNMLAMIQRSRTPPTVVPNPNEGAPSELLTKVSELNWAGPVDSLLINLGEKVGYTYVKPALTLGYDMPIVNLDIRDQTVATALDAISLQIQETMQIVVDPDAKTFSLRYNGEPKKVVPGANAIGRSSHRHVKHIVHHVKASRS